MKKLVFYEDHLDTTMGKEYLVIGENENDFIVLDDVKDEHFWRKNSEGVVFDVIDDEMKCCEGKMSLDYESEYYRLLDEVVKKEIIIDSLIYQIKGGK